MSEDEERPVHRVVDCATGQAVDTPLTDQEWAEHKARSTAHAQSLTEASAAEVEFQAAVAAHTDPVTRELARRLGIRP
jgi:hypothetical protein